MTNVADANPSLNPYLVFQGVISTFGRPTLSPGSHTRLVVLYSLLAYVTVSSFFLIVLSAIPAKSDGRAVWLCKIARRPQGSYFLVNQYLCVPMCIFSSTVVWIGYVTILQKWWESTAEGHFTERVVFWFGLANIPLLVIAWMITFSVLSGANITSSRKSNLALHIVGPWVMNSSIGIIFPASVIPLIVTSARTGQGWIKINNAVAAVYAQAGRDALTFNEVLTPSQVQAMVVQMYEEGYALLLQPWDELLELYRASMICFTVAVAILCVINIGGGILLLASLRLSENSNSTLVWKDAPVVAPLRPLATGTSPLDSSGFKSELSPEYDDASVKDEGLPQKLEGRGLDWYMTLFYFCVVPFGLAGFGWGVWLSDTSVQAFVKDPQAEIATLGLQWVGVVVGSAVITALIVQRIYKLQAPAKRIPYNHTPVVLELRSSSKRPSASIC